MVISIAPGTQTAAKTQPGKLIDMNWDPITHIVGGLGIYTNIDFENRRDVEWIVKLGEAAEYLFDHIIFQAKPGGVHFCEQMVREANPSLWEQAKTTEAPHAKDHGYRTIADIRQYQPAIGRSAAFRPSLSGSYIHKRHRRVTSIGDAVAYPFFDTDAVRAPINESFHRGVVSPLKGTLC